MREKKRKKEFDAVQIMREIRNQLSEKYTRDPEIEERELEEIRKKYSIKPKVKSIG